MKGRLKRLFVLTAVAIVVTLISLEGDLAWGQTTWNVPGDSSNICTTSNPSCNTIQGAVNAASSGDTINVAAGEDKENAC